MKNNVVSNPVMGQSGTATIDAINKFRGTICETFVIGIGAAGKLSSGKDQIAARGVSYAKVGKTKYIPNYRNKGSH